MRFTSRWNWNLEMLVFLWREENPENPEKSPRSKDENQQQTVPVELCIILYKAFLTLILWMKSESVTIQMKAF